LFGLDKDEWASLALSFHISKKLRRLTPCQAAVLLDKAVQSTSFEVLADRLGFADSTTIQKIHSLSKLDPSLASLVSWGGRSGTISMSSASQIMRLKSKEYIEKALFFAVKSRMTKEESRQLVQITQRSELAFDDALEESIKTRPKIEQSEIIIGKFSVLDLYKTKYDQNIIDLFNDQVLTKTNDAERALRTALIRQLPDIPIAAIRVNNGYFTLMFNDENAKKFKSVVGADAIEDFVSGLLLETISSN